MAMFYLSCDDISDFKQIKQTIMIRLKGAQRFPFHYLGLNYKEAELNAV